MQRQLIVAGNWKMNKNFEEGLLLTREIAAQLKPGDVQVILCPPYIHLQAVANAIENTSNLALGGQDCHQEDSGAYTGEISAGMLQSVGADYVILGHSERREYFGESEELLSRKVDQALATGLKPIFCCGEKLEVREAGDHDALVAKQVKDALFHLEADAFAKIVIAYEPVWAIGTGKTASPEQAQEMHAYIRGLIEDKYGEEVADATSILYGGSVKPHNAEELFGKKDVDGGLIGGASLKASDFIAIVEAMKAVIKTG